MKSLLFTAALAGVALTGNAFAYSPKDAIALPAPRPVASSVVQPTGLPSAYSGKVVNIEFSLDQAGRPRAIEVLRVDDAVLKRQLVEAFRQWRFAPGVNDPALSQKRFVLPLQLRPEV
jgi:hypothetical protein